MPFITFFARNKYLALCKLTRTMVVGRSLDCEIFVPDVFVSRRHARIEPTPAGWLVTDLGSANGIFVDGMRVARHLLREGDKIEIGTVVVVFHENNLGEVASATAPFGKATPISELLDTVYAQGLRPVDFSRQALRRDLWELKFTPEEAAILDEEEPEPLPGRYPDEWVELDIEWQLAENTFFTDPRIRGGWEWTDLDIDLEPLLTLPMAMPEADAAGGMSDAPSVSLLDDDSTDDASADAVQRRPRGVPTAQGSLLDMISDAEQHYDREQEASAPPSKWVFRAPGQRLSLWDRAKAAFDDFRDSDFIWGLRQRPRRVVGIAAALLVVMYAGMWTTRRLSRPPTHLSNGKANPAYFNGDDHS